MKKRYMTVVALLLAPQAYPASGRHPDSYTNEQYGFAVFLPAGTRACPTIGGVPNHGVRIVRTRKECPEKPFSPNETDIAADYNVTDGASITAIAQTLCGIQQAPSAYKIGTDDVMLCQETGNGKSYISLHKTGADRTDWIVYNLYIGKAVGRYRTGQFFSAIHHLR